MRTAFALPIFALLLAALAPAATAQATGSTTDPVRDDVSLAADKFDYAPLSSAVFTGSGFLAGESVQLQVTHADGVERLGPEYKPWTVIADAIGKFKTDWRVCDCQGALLELTARGASSGLQLSIRFTDSHPLNKKVGYYDMRIGQGNSSQVSAILTAGELPVLLSTLTAGELLGVEIILVQNPNNGGFGAEYLSRRPEIQAAVNSGKVLIIHDRAVAGAAGILPGGGGITTVRDFAADTNIDVLDGTTLVTNGHSGMVDNFTLDGGYSSNHGFVEGATLPPGAKKILTTGDSNRVVTAAYPYGAGWVIYSTIPLDFYLFGGSPIADRFSNIYAPNVIAYAASLVSSNQPPQAVPDSYSTPEDSPLDVPAPGVLGNDVDADGDPLHAVLASGPSQGTLTLRPDGSFNYVAAPNFNGTDSFTYKSNDTEADSNATTVTITITPVNDPPGFSVIADQVIDEDAPTQALSITDVSPGPPDESAQTVTLVAASSNPALIPAPSISGSGSTRLLSFAPIAQANGQVVITVTANDNQPANNTFTRSFLITVNAVNDAPVASNDTATTLEDTPVTVAVIANDLDIDGDALAVASFTQGANGAVSCLGGSCTYAPGANFNGTDQYTYVVGDGRGGFATGLVTVMVAPVNDPPSDVNVIATQLSVIEGGTVYITASFQNVDPGDTHTALIDWGDGTNSTLNLGIATGFSASHQYLDDQPVGADAYRIAITIVDGADASASGATSVEVANVAPVISAVTGPTSPVALGGSATVAASFTDVGSLDTHTCTFGWGDGTQTVVNAAGTGNGACSATHTYATSNVYEVEVTVTDGDGGSAETSFQYVVVYNANGGFVTGGGWIMSLAGAYVPNPALTGKANFGFVSKYKPGSSEPTGNTEFQFKAADLNFKSTSYEWMVISGSKVRYRGVGQINGAGEYGFELTAWDGNMPGGGGTDRFRLQIWDTNRGNAMLYDNQMGAADGAEPTTALGGGSIVIHK